MHINCTSFHNLGGWRRCLIWWANTGTGCLEWLWSFHLWKYSKSNRTWSWTTCCVARARVWGVVELENLRDAFQRKRFCNVGGVCFSVHLLSCWCCVSSCRHRCSLVSCSVGFRAIHRDLPPTGQCALEGEARSPGHCLCVGLFIPLDRSTNSGLEQLHNQ